MSVGSKKWRSTWLETNMKDIHIWGCKSSPMVKRTQLQQLFFQVYKERAEVIKRHTRRDKNSAVSFLGFYLFEVVYIWASSCWFLEIMNVNVSRSHKSINTSQEVNIQFACWYPVRVHLPIWEPPLVKWSTQVWTMDLDHSEANQLTNPVQIITMGE